MKRRIWLDTVVLAERTERDDVLRELDRMVANDYHLIIANTILDVKAFQMYQKWVESHLNSGNISIEIWNTPDEMVSKPFYWSSAKMWTDSAKTLEEAVAELPNRQKILSLRDLLDRYGIPRGKWEQGPYNPLSEDAQTVLRLLGLPLTATRTEVLEACKKTDRMKQFEVYNLEYNKVLACQHLCTHVFCSDGTLKRV